MALQVRRSVDEVLAQSKILHMDEAIRLLLPEAAPVTTMTMKASKKPVNNPTFYHREREAFPRWVTILNGETAAATTPDVSDAHGEYFNLSTSIGTWGVQLFIPRTGEIMLVMIESAGALTSVRRGVGGTTAAALLAGDDAFIMGPASREDGVAPEANMVLEVLKTFYTMIMKKSTLVTKSAVATAMYHGNDRLFEQRVAGIEHKLEMELQLLLGGTGASTDHDTASVYYRHSAGLNGTITSHVVDVDGILTEPVFWSLLEDCSEYHYADWLLAASPRVLGAINGWGINKVQLSPKSKEYGVDLQMIITPHGNVHLAKENILRGDHLSGYAFLIPMPIENFIKYRPLSANGENRDTRLKLDIKKDDDPDYYKDEWHTEFGFEIYEESKFGQLIGVTG